MDDVPEPDRLPDTPHPREAVRVIGHDEPAAILLDAINSGRLHHAWMLTGPQGIGKATLAYQAAMSILTKPADDDGGLFGDAPEDLPHLGLPQDHPINARIRARSEPGLFVLRRPIDEKTHKLKQIITVDEVRKMRHFFGMSAGGNGRRVVIVDAVDDLNVQAANALLKMLEEPPKGAVMFLITHQPGRVLPTIRSRCRVLQVDPLQPADLQAAFAQALPGETFDPGLLPLANGSVGQAITLTSNGGLDVYKTLVRLFAQAPALDRADLFKLADDATARGNDGGMARVADMVDILLARLARSSVMGADGTQVCPGERELFARLNPSPQTARVWAELQHALGNAMRSGMAVNLDPTALILDTAIKIEETASRTLR